MPQTGSNSSITGAEVVELSSHLSGCCPLQPFFMLSSFFCSHRSSFCSHLSSVWSLLSRFYSWFLLQYLFLFVMTRTIPWSCHLLGCFAWNGMHFWELYGSACATRSWLKNQKGWNEGWWWEAEKEENWKRRKQLHLKVTTCVLCLWSDRFNGKRVSIIKSAVLYMTGYDKKYTVMATKLNEVPTI